MPRFKKQIAKGGPVTVTHPDMTRYFMTIPEAGQLVMQASAFGTGGEVFVLDMGQPVRIVDMARDLIRLSGLEPDRDVRIEFVGLRAGERLTEQLVGDDERLERTGHPRIFVARSPLAAGARAGAGAEELLERCAAAGAEDCGQAFAEWVSEVAAAGVTARQRPQAGSGSRSPCA